MPRVDTPPSTHFDNCWRVHPECAVAMIERWLPVIEAAKAGDAETWERTAHYLGQMWWGGDAEDVCRAIDSALKEGSDE